MSGASATVAATRPETVPIGTFSPAAKVRDTAREDPSSQRSGKREWFRNGALRRFST